MKNFLSKFKYLLIGIGLAIAGTVYAINVTVPQATQVGDLIQGCAGPTGNYCLTHPGSTGQVLTVVGGVPAWAAATGSTASILPLIANGTVAGVNATSSTVSFNVQGSSNLNPFTVASSSGTSLFIVAANGSTTISSLGTGIVQSTSGGSLYVVPINTYQPAGTYIQASSTLTAGGVATFSPNITYATSTDTNLLLQIVCGVATCTYTPQWTGTLAAGRLNSNVVQSISTSTSGTVFTGSISAQNLALVFPASPTFTNGTFTGTLGVTGQTTLSTASTTALSDSGSLWTNIQSGTQCLHVNGSGLVSGTGSDCGAGGSGNSAWTIGNGLIYNATSTNSVLVGTSTPTTAQFFIQGTGSKNPLTIASSSGASYLSVLASGNVGIGTTTPAALLTLQGSSGSTADLFDVASSTGANIFQVLNSTQSVLSVGTSSTASNLIVQGNSSFPTQPLFIFASSSGTTLFETDASGHQWTGGTAPTCGTGCSSVTGDDSTMRVVTGSSVTAVTVNFASKWVTPGGTSISPSCVGSDESGGTTTSDPSSTPTTVTINLSASLTTKNLTIQCRGSLNFTN